MVITCKSVKAGMLQTVRNTSYRSEAKDEQRSIVMTRMIRKASSGGAHTPCIKSKGDEQPGMIPRMTCKRAHRLRNTIVGWKSEMTVASEKEER